MDLSVVVVEDEDDSSEELAKEIEMMVAMITVTVKAVKMEPNHQSKQPF